MGCVPAFTALGQAIEACARITESSTKLKRTTQVEFGEMRDGSIGISEWDKGTRVLGLSTVVAVAPFMYVRTVRTASFLLNPEKSVVLCVVSRKIVHSHLRWYK